jgi:hypothetical protein
MTRTFLVGMLLTVVALVSGCGGASKPPLQPDSDGTSSLGDGGADPSATPPSPQADPRATPPK